MAVFLLIPAKTSRVFTSDFERYKIIDSKAFMDKKYAKYLLEKTHQDYNQIADDFSITRNAVWSETKSVLDKYLMPGEKILDLGCGNGRYFNYLQEKKVNYFGVDNSEKLIEIAKNNYPDANFQVADALSLPFPDDFFDKIISIAVLHHIPSEELRAHFLAETKRVLKPGGILILTVWNFREMKEFLLFFKFVIIKLLGSKLDFGDFLEPWDKKALRYFHYFSQNGLKNLARKTGFKIKEAGIIRNERGNRRNSYLVAEK